MSKTLNIPDHQRALAATEILWKLRETLEEVAGDLSGFLDGPTHKSSRSLADIRSDFQTAVALSAALDASRVAGDWTPDDDEFRNAFNHESLAAYDGLGRDEIERRNERVRQIADARERRAVQHTGGFAAGEIKVKTHSAGSRMWDAAEVRALAFEAAGAATAPLLRDHPDYVFPAERVGDAVEAVLHKWGGSALGDPKCAERVDLADDDKTMIDLGALDAEDLIPLLRGAAVRRLRNACEAIENGPTSQVEVALLDGEEIDPEVDKKAHADHQSLLNALAALRAVGSRMPARLVLDFAQYAADDVMGELSHHVFKASDTERVLARSQLASRLRVLTAAARRHLPADEANRDAAAGADYEVVGVSVRKVEEEAEAPEPGGDQEVVEAGQSDRD